MMTFEEQWALHKNDGEKYQGLLGEMVLREQPKVVVETGGGYSSLFILKAMDHLGEGRLYTIDPDTQVKFTHPRFKWLANLSTEKLGELYLDIGPWDLFLHDSDHEVECQTFEYEMAYGMVRPGGWILSDDFEWGNPIHWAWKKFLARHGLSDVEMRSARATRKPHLVPALAQDERSVIEYTSLCLELAAEAKKAMAT